MAEVTCPSYLTGGLRERWDELAPTLQQMGAVDGLNAPTLVKYLMTEAEYLRVSKYVAGSIENGDAEGAGKWLAAQDRLLRQCLTLADALGLTPEARRAKGLRAPRSKT